MSLEPKRIVVFRTGHLGDNIVALPAYWAIRKAFPNAHLTLLSNYDPKNRHHVSARNVLPEKGLFDSWITYPNSANKLRITAGLAELGFRLRAGKYDSLFYLLTRVRSRRQIERDIRFFRVAGIKQIFGVRNAIANILPRMPPVPSPQITSEGDFLMESLLSEHIVDAENAHCRELLLTEDEKSAAAEFVARANLANMIRGPIVAIAPGSKWPSKTWSIQRLKATVSKLIGSHTAFPIVFGGEEDQRVGKELLEAWNTGANAAGALTVLQAAAALEHCDLFLGNDTGTMHLAAHLGVPVVAIFGSTEPALTVPRGSDHRILRHHVACSPCFLRECPLDFRCMRAIPVGEVVKAIESALRIPTQTRHVSA